MSPCLAPNGAPRRAISVRPRVMNAAGYRPDPDHPNTSARCDNVLDAPPSSQPMISDEEVYAQGWLSFRRLACVQLKRRTALEARLR